MCLALLFLFLLVFIRFPLCLHLLYVRGCPKAYHAACIKRDEAFFRSRAKWNCGTCRFTYIYILFVWIILILNFHNLNFVAYPHSIMFALGFCDWWVFDLVVVTVENSGESSKFYGSISTYKIR